MVTITESLDSGKATQPQAKEHRSEAGQTELTKRFSKLCLHKAASEVAGKVESPEVGQATPQRSEP